MKFLTLELENWSSYEGQDNRITFATTPGSEITVITANNGGGKTSILKAFSFVLYGAVNSAISRNADLSKLDDFPNRPALESGDKVQTSVSLTFEHQGAEWKLKRQFTARQSQNVKLLVLGPVEASLIQVGKGAGISTEKIEDFINDNILNRQVSHFYFFDGVLLDDIQSQLTKKDETSRKLVMTSVENALGLRFLDHLNLNLRASLAKVDSEIAKQQRAERQNTELLKKISDDEDSLKAAQVDLQKVEIMSQTQAEKRDEHDAKLQSIDPSTKEKAIERTRLQEELKGLLADEEKAIEDLRFNGERAWLAPLEAKLSALFSQKEVEQEKNRETGEATTSISAKIQNLSLSIDSKSCVLCSHEHDETDLVKLKTEIESLRSELERLPPISTSDEGLLFKISRAMVDSKKIEVVNQTVNHHDELLVRIADVKRKIGRIGDSLGNLNENIDVKWEEAQRAEANTKVEELARQIADINITISGLRSNLAANRAKLTDGASVSKKDQDARVLLDTICLAIEASFVRFRDEMRAQVEAKATEYLAVLTSEPDIYGSVEISSDYQIKIKSPEGKVLQISNAGHKQILTTAFVSAMAAVSTEKTPFVMDTALAHLDVANSRKMLEWAKFVDQQVILLVNPKELPKEVAHKILGSTIGRQYIIDKMAAEVSHVKELS